MMSTPNPTFMIGALSAVLGGGITVARNLTSHMALLRPDSRFDLYCTHQEVAGYRYPANVDVIYLPKLRSRWSRLWWEQGEMPLVVDQKGYSAVLALGGYVSMLTRAPQVAVWQNPNVFSPPGVTRPWAERILIGVQRRAQSVSMRRSVQNVFLTHNSVQLASRYWRMENIPHLVIHSGVDVECLSAIKAVPLESREQLVLSVGHTYSHKNYEVLIDAMNEYRCRYGSAISLVIVGAPANQRYFEKLQSQIKTLSLTGIVSMVGPASTRQVIELMSRARVYVVTSLLETFGLTMFEAMGQGLPVLASNATCHPEVCGDAALYCDPHDPVDVATKINQIMTDSALSAGLRDRGFLRLEQFSWDRSAKAYLSVLEDVSRKA